MAQTGKGGFKKKEEKKGKAESWGYVATICICCSWFAELEKAAFGGSPQSWAISRQFAVRTRSIIKKADFFFSFLVW